MTSLQVKKLRNMFPKIWNKHITKEDKIERCIDKLIQKYELLLEDKNGEYAELLKVKNYLIKSDTFYYPNLIFDKIKKYIVEKFNRIFK